MYISCIIILYYLGSLCSFHHGIRRILSGTDDNGVYENNVCVILVSVVRRLDDRFPDLES